MRRIVAVAAVTIMTIVVAASTGYLVGDPSFDRPTELTEALGVIAGIGAIALIVGNAIKVLRTRVLRPNRLRL